MRYASSDGSPSPRSIHVAPRHASRTRARGPRASSRSMSATSGMTYALSGSSGSIDHREAEVRRQAVGDARPALARVVRAVDAAVELHEEPLGLLRVPVHVVDAEGERVLAGLLGHVARVEVLVPVPPRLAAVVGEPDADRRDRERDAGRIARPRRDRVHAHAARARAPLGTGRLLPERLVQLPARAAVVALEEHARRAAGIEVPSSSAGTTVQSRSSGFSASSGSSRPLGLLPFGRRGRRCRRPSGRRTPTSRTAR